MCPVSRHRFTYRGSVSCRNLSTRSWVSTCVSTCGWKTSEMPYSSAITRPSSSVPLIRLSHCSVSRSAASVAVPVCMSVYCSGRWIRYFAPTAPSSRASLPKASMAASSASFPLCRPAKTVPPHTSRPPLPGPPRRRSGGCGGRPRAPGGPACGARRAAARGPAAGTPAGRARSRRSRPGRPRRGTAATSPGAGPRGTRHPRSRERSRGGAGTGRWARSCCDLLLAGPEERPLLGLVLVVGLTGLLRALELGDLGDGHVPPVLGRRHGGEHVGLDVHRRGAGGSAGAGQRLAELVSGLHADDIGAEALGVGGEIDRQGVPGEHAGLRVAEAVAGPEPLRTQRFRQ